jgi:hypothetical protein
MRRSISILVAMVLIFMTAIVKIYAIDWQSLNVNLVDKKEDGERTIITLKDKQNQVFKVIYLDEAMLEKMADTIIKYKNEYYSWKDIRFKDLSFMVSAGFLEIMLIPTEIAHQNLDPAKAVPAGITMTYYPERDILRYDFRIMKDNQLIRLAGDYLGEAEMLGRINSAYNNPLAYLQRTDPEYLQQEIEKLQQALLYLYNEDWLNRQNPIPPETIRKVVELKQSNPKITKNELWKALKKEKVKITKQELTLILIFYFNEYP